MKVSELSGAMLDYWVAKAEGLNVLSRETPSGVSYWAEGDNRFIGYIGGEHLPQYNPSQDRHLGGMISERERINTNFYDGTPGLDDWSADIGNPAGSRSFGPTPLIAAMRAFVASRFGDTVPELSTQQEG
jgi:hypothetical protein